MTEIIQVINNNFAKQQQFHAIAWQYKTGSDEEHTKCLN